MNKKRIKMLLVTMMICTMMFAESITAFAAPNYAQSAGDAGSTRVTVEVGFNGTHAYATVSATNYVDAEMEGHAQYMFNGKLGTVSLDGGFSQATSGGVERNCPADAFYAMCRFNVYSDDGYYMNFLSAN